MVQHEQIAAAGTSCTQAADKKVSEPMSAITVLAAPPNWVAPYRRLSWTFLPLVAARD